MSAGGLSPLLRARTAIAPWQSRAGGRSTAKAAVELTLVSRDPAPANVGPRKTRRGHNARPLWLDVEHLVQTGDLDHTQHVRTCSSHPHVAAISPSPFKAATSTPSPVESTKVTPARSTTI